MAFMAHDDVLEFEAVAGVKEIALAVPAVVAKLDVDGTKDKALAVPATSVLDDDKA